MDYQPITCVWEVTMGCNMRCGHCGSSCENALPGELSTAEALNLCDQIAELGVRWVTLSGGEPLTRKDIDQIVKRLHDNGVTVNMITNGWLMQEKMVDRLKQSGIATVAISIDGTRETHNKVRKEGAFEHAESAFRLLKSRGVTTGAVTTITNQNINILNDIKEELIRIGVDSWQVQLGLPMGNLKKRPDWLLQPEKVKDIIDFCHETAKEGRIKIYTADCIGYYTKKELEVKKIGYNTENVSMWSGCNAGIRGFGILHNGDILGCTSIRDKEFIEGNVRERSLRSIWESKDSFLWRRNLLKEQLSGRCKTCAYGSRCLGGCPNTRLTMKGDIYSENEYCAYNLHQISTEEKYKKYENPDELFDIADRLIKSGIYQEAVIALNRALELEPDNVQTYVAKAYAEYMCENYELCRESNEAALRISPNNPDALSGYAHALFKLGEKERAIGYMRSSAAVGGIRQNEYIEDLRIMLM